MTESNPPVLSEEIVSNELLQKIISGHASEADQALWNQIAADSPMLQDALEGLQGIQDPQLIASLQQQINHQLLLKVRKKHKTRLQRITTEPITIAITVVLLLIAAISVYLIFTTGKTRP
jgi:hypothetical protein